MNSIKKFSDNSQEIEISGSKKNPSLREIMKLEKKIGVNEETLIAKGVLYFNSKDFIKAEYYFKKSLKNKPNKQALVVLMKTYNNQDCLEKIIPAFENNREFFEDDPIFYQLWGYALFELKDYMAAYDKFLISKNLGISDELIGENSNFIIKCLKNSKMTGELYTFTKQLITDEFVNEYVAEAFTSSCVTLEKNNEAIEFLENTNFDWSDCPGVNGYGAIAYYIGGKDISKSLKLNERALFLDPSKIEFRWNTALSQLRAGKIEEGIKNYQSRWDWEQFPSPRRNFSKPKFLPGIDKNAKILVWSEQGIGDEVLFASALNDFKREYPNLIFETHPKTYEIMNHSFPDILVRTAEFNLDLSARIEDFDFHIPIGDVYHRLIEKHLSFFKDGNSLSDKWYLNTDKLRENYWKHKLSNISNKPKIGICWTSSNLADGRYRDHTDLEIWRYILERNDIDFVSLQYNHDYEDMQNEFFDLAELFIDTGYLDQMNDLEGAVALIKNLDLVITSAASPFSISASTGVETWFFSRPNPFMLGRTEKFSAHPVLDNLKNYMSYQPYSDDQLVKDFSNELDNFVETFKNNQKLKKVS